MDIPFEQCSLWIGVGRYRECQYMRNDFHLTNYLNTCGQRILWRKVLMLPFIWPFRHNYSDGVFRRGKVNKIWVANQKLPRISLYILNQSIGIRRHAAVNCRDYLSKWVSYLWVIDLFKSCVLNFKFFGVYYIKFKNKLNFYHYKDESKSLCFAREYQKLGNMSQQ